MAEQQSNRFEAGQADFEHHARDYGRVMAMLKWGAIAAVILALVVVLIIAN